jgi:hypothetical protein
VPMAPFASTGARPWATRPLVSSRAKFAVGRAAEPQLD